MSVNAVTSAVPVEMAQAQAGQLPVETQPAPAGQLPVETQPAPAPGAAPAVLSDVEKNIAARQEIRQAFINVAGGDKAGVGSDATELKVGQLLADKLSTINFALAGGNAYKSEIAGFIGSVGKKFDDGEIQHLNNLINEAAATLKPVTQSPTSPPSPTGGTSGAGQPGGTGGANGPSQAGSGPTAATDQKVLIGITSLLVDALSDGKVDEKEAKVLTEGVGQLIAYLSQPDTGRTGSASGASAAQMADGSPANRMHDSVWFLHKLGLATYLDGFASAQGTQSLTGLVVDTLRNAHNYRQS